MHPRILSLLSFVALAVSSSPARADDGQRSPALGIAADIGFYNGVGAGGQVTAGMLGLRATAGWNLVLVTAGDEAEVDSIHAFSTGQLNADLLLLPIQPRPGVQLGAALGYKYNTLLGHGVGLAFDAQLARSRSLSWHLIGGVAYYPSGDERVRDREDLSGSDLNFPFGSGLQSGASFGITFHP